MWGWFKKKKTCMVCEKTWKHIHLECGVCGVDQVVLIYNYSPPSLGRLHVISYGHVNLRKMLVCKTHTDAEVQAKIDEII